MSKSVLIVGTGLGGLATGLRLISRGYKVTFVEKNHKAGGRLNQLKKDGFTFDTGPSFFSMPFEFEELINDCGLEMPFSFVELEPLYTVHFKSGNKKFYLHKDIDKLSAQFEGIEDDFKNKFTAYLNKCEALYNDTVDIVIRQNFDNLPAYLKALMQVNPAHLGVLLKSFWAQTGKYFKSKEARQIVSLIAFFLGRTPYDTNAVFTLLSHIEFRHKGYYNIKGGMYTIVEGLLKELLQKNATFHYNTEITDFTSQRDTLTALIDKNGKAWEADIFVINADAAIFRGQVLKHKKYSDKKLLKKSWTMGYLTFYLGVNIKLPQVEHHNYFLGDNFKTYAKTVVSKSRAIKNPYYYVNVLSKYNTGCAPEGCEALFFVCPVPNLLNKPEWSDKDDIVNGIIADFSKRIDKNIVPHIVSKTVYTPEDWQSMMNSFKGTGLGLSHKMHQIGALRPKNHDEVYKNTFYVGASTAPGAGLPMVIISSKLATERILKSEPAI